MKVTKISNGTCGKSFTQAGNLRKHIKTVHEGHKNHKCNSSEKSFSQRSNLKTQIQIVHDGHNDHNCGHCGKYFTQFSKVRQIV